jgi:hypothetical protein
MTERLQLTDKWSLRKLQLGDRSEWALQFMGMDWVRISEFLPSPSAPTWLDDEMRKFAADCREMAEKLRGEA